MFTLEKWVLKIGKDSKQFELEPGTLVLILSQISVRPMSVKTDSWKNFISFFRDMP